MEHSPTSTASELALAEISRRGDEILVGNDADAIAALFADEWVSLDSRGYTTKAELIEWIRSGRLAHHSMSTVGDLRIQLTGDSAIISARKASTGLWEGNGYATEEWITDILQQRDGRWLCVFSQKSPIA
jgi:hypothetical protein